MRVLFYGRLAEVVGQEVEVEAPSPCSIAQLRSTIITGHPNAVDSLLNARVRACVGNLIVADDHIVREEDCVEFLAPVSGG